MSQHKLATKLGEQEVIVTIGYDRLLDQVFMSIVPKYSPVETIYTSLEIEETPDLDDFENKLNELGIEVPAAIFEAAYLDSVFNESSNLIRWYDASGAITQPEVV